jgi:hypothetical protein
VQSAIDRPRRNVCQLCDLSDADFSHTLSTKAILGHATSIVKEKLCGVLYAGLFVLPSLIPPLPPVQEFSLLVKGIVPVIFQPSFLLQTALKSVTVGRCAVPDTNILKPPE